MKNTVAGIFRRGVWYCVVLYILFGRISGLQIVKVGWGWGWLVYVKIC